MGCCCSTENERKRETKKRNEGSLRHEVKIPDEFDIERAKQATKPLTEFSLNLFKKIAAEKPSENVVISPISVALALAMAESGADGSTRTALRNALGGNDNEFDPRPSFQSIQRLLWVQDDATTLTIANGLFHDRKFKLESEYLREAKEGFESEIDGVDFENHPQAAASRINSWISKRTGGRIKNLIQSAAITNKTAVILANAIYLKAKWQKAFQKEAIETMPFYRQGQDENPQEVPFLCVEDKYEYADDIDFDTVGIPYSSFAGLCFYIILPKERNGITKVEGQLTEAKLRSIVDTSTRRKIDLKFPKFGIRTPVGLKKILKELGLELIFDEVNADFGRMGRMKIDSDDRKVYVSDVRHEAFIEVDEKGTEAAAATVIRMKVAKCSKREPPEAPIRFVADHPFIFAIVYQETGTVVFMGKVNHVEEDVK